MTAIPSGVRVLLTNCTDDCITNFPSTTCSSWKFNVIGMSNFQGWSNKWVLHLINLFFRVHFEPTEPLAHHVPAMCLILDIKLHTSTLAAVLCRFISNHTHSLISSYSQQSQWSPTKWEVCFPSPIMYRRRKLAHPVPTRAFLIPSPDMSMLFAPFKYTHQPPSVPFFFCSHRTYLPRTLLVVTSWSQASHDGVSTYWWLKG